MTDIINQIRRLIQPASPPWPPSGSITEWPPMGGRFTVDIGGGLLDDVSTATLHPVGESQHQEARDVLTGGWGRVPSDRSSYGVSRYLPSPTALSLILDHAGGIVPAAAAPTVNPPPLVFTKLGVVAAGREVGPTSPRPCTRRRGCQAKAVLEAGSG